MERCESNTVCLHDKTLILGKPQMSAKTSQLVTLLHNNLFLIDSTWPNSTSTSSLNLLKVEKCKLCKKTLILLGLW